MIHGRSPDWVSLMAIRFSSVYPDFTRQTNQDMRQAKRFARSGLSGKGKFIKEPEHQYVNVIVFVSPELDVLKVNCISFI